MNNARSNRTKLILSACALLSASGWAWAADLHVPAQFSTIQSAVSAAQAGDRVIVAPGLYQETIDLAFKPISLLSSDGPYVTTISGNSTNTVLRNPGDGTTIGGFRIIMGFNSLGGGIRIDGTSPMIYECFFESNQATFGGAVYVRNDASPTFMGCLFMNNTASFGGAIYCRDGAAPSFIDAEIAHNTAVSGAGGGLHSFQAAPTVHRSTFIGNSSSLKSGGAIYASGSTIAVNGCLFDNNFALEHGGGIYVTGGQTTLANSKVRHSSAGMNGGGLYISSASADIVSVLFHDNSSLSGGGAFVVGGQPKFINVTMSRNSASGGGGAMRVVSAGPQVRNAILWNNVPDEISRTQDATNVSYSCVQGGWTGAGHSNISADPLFVAPAMGDFRVVRGAPTIDLGNNEAIPDGDPNQNMGSPVPPISFLVDLDGASRIIAGVVDMGAYEIQPEACTGDVNGDSRVDFRDMIMVLSKWGSGCDGCPEDINGDGVVSLPDLIAVLTQWGNCPN